MKKLILLFYYLKQKRKSGFSERGALESHQTRLLKKLLRHLKKNSPYYANLLEGATVKDWEKLPVISKPEFMEHFQEINTLGISAQAAFREALAAEESRNFTPTLKGATVGLSSGTSGHRGLFMATDFERFKYAGILLAKGLPGSLFSRWKIAFFLRANSNLYTSVQSRRIQFEYFDLLQEESLHLQRLSALTPDVLIAPPSVLVRLAQKISSGELRLQKIPKKIISVAEVLEPLDQKKIEAAFGRRVDQIYQATEGFLGITCKHGTLHLNEDLQIIEKKFLNPEKTKFFPIITDLHRATQPVVRYQLNDVLTLKAGPPCPCGSVLTALEHIDGRADDILYLEKKDGRELLAVYPDFFRRAVITTSLPVEDYLIVQENPGELKVSLKTKAEDKEACIAEITRHLQDLLAQMKVKQPRIFFSDEFPQRRDQKKRRVQRLWTHSGPTA